MGVFIMKRARIDPNHHKGIIVTEDLTGDPLDITGADLTNSNPMHVAIVDAAGDQVSTFGGGNGNITDGVNTAIKATVLDLTSANPLTVAITDASGNQITSFGGGTQYTEQTPSTGSDILTMAGVVRNDSLGSLAATNGDRTMMQTDDLGLLKVTVLNIPTVNIGTGAQVDALTDTQLRASPVQVEIPDELLKKLIDDTTTTNVTYIGVASQGTATSDPVWRIKKIDETSGVEITWTGTGFTAVWDDRVTEIYS